MSVKRGLSYGKRDLLYAQKRPTTNIGIPEVRMSVKRGLSDGKRDLLYAQKRPIIRTKETYY
jgi:hypothetical protein